ncbi:MAG: cytochrome d ubiquinol oxidase subunit II [Nitrospirae bacterium CG22_combo_CG10-13_8_21_14_all_44_11]|nr:cytochrome d ubiquinol oxidase subunit II [Nitrospirota bacterium]PIP69328.1 MAG: cytochrome d ubiquinol oxidase subunit II [Nitrospirae bacterium CG22_combo_CG10-13_8_21_14_all_44_11]PIV67528.1 MAG: cytochrome d ubiquinol oxidase subunit II [Nitrospirae bacterium CG01_land_8_20_14_3_00_44_22]PIW89722.1 MAG: cytochrome d ubiquinol oxidase subunit II [Nitrospirae bacterium CG_4_8_14_3_um_filter_44_28]
MEFQITWFILWGVLWAVYFMLDGFDFGVGILHSFIGKTEGEKKTIIRTIGSVWNGNEVWLVTAGGATFAAFPTTYALMFSYLYTPLLLILFALIFRGVALEFRGKVDSDGWKKGWDIAIFLGSFLPALLFGVAFGNIFQGIPMDANGYHGTLFTLLNPYGILTGLLFVLLFIVHGTLWLTVKTNGELSKRASSVTDKTWYALLVVAVLFLIYTAFATNLYKNYLDNPVWFAIPAAAVLALLGIKIFAVKGAYLKAFYSSCLTILTVTFTGIIGLYPNLIPSSIDKNYSLTIFNSSSSPYTLKIMTVVAVLFVPVVIAYQIWVYRVFRNKITVSEVLEDKESY